VKLRAAVPATFGLMILFAVPAFAADTKPAASKPATTKPAASKPAASKPAAPKTAAPKTAGTTEKAAAAPVDSLARLEKLVAKDSTNFDNLYQLGVMYLDRERTPEASHVLAKAVSLKPNDVKALVNLGAANDALGLSSVAQGYYRKALTVSPGDSVATCRLASSLYAQQNYKESMDLLRKLIADKPRSHCAYFTLGVAFADAGLYRDAIRAWQKVVEYAPESAEAVSARESIEVLTKYLTGQVGQ
jgi:tetratricopeptide (TPR) repeat protein